MFHITKDNISVRMAVVEEATWAPPLVGEALRGVYKEASEVLGREFIYPGDEE